MEAAIFHLNMVIKSVSDVVSRFVDVYTRTSDCTTWETHIAKKLS